MVFGRRLVIGAALASLLTTRAWADATDLAVTFDTAAGPAISLAVLAYTARTVVRVRIHPTFAGLVLPQLQRDIQNDILITQTTLLDRAEGNGLVAPGGRTGSQITRHVCVDGWSMIGTWSGTPLRGFLTRIGADTTARYVGFECADGYYKGMDMPTALHPQTLMAFKLSDEVLPTRHGFPFKIRVPTKLGFDNPKFVTTVYATNQQPRGFWTDRGYNWFSGI